MFIVNYGAVRILDNEGRQLDDITVRKEIAEFAIAMEIEMSKKELRYGEDSTIYPVKFLTEKLLEEREEVDLELKNINKEGNVVSFELSTELIHEAIMTMLIRNKIKASL